ncbi:MAG: UDP-N-acetylmuramoyl-L-alanine--D-glutamate ligase [Clostridia bacterium]|nr:UDP-N-acetylmuramoyl-L-alanine--D-glutamate ligase [Clostridia bacterium]
MLGELINYFKDKKIIILGFGREGISTYKLIREHLKNQKLYIADRQENFYDEYDFLKNDENVDFIDGEKYLQGLEDYDIIMKSPGISFVGLDTSKIENKIKSQIELLFEFFDAKFIGVTGTKGKSTTSSLIYKVLSEQNINCMFMGNIGIPAFDMVNKIEPGMIIILELSSHQLEFVKKSPNISILLNIFEEHLDHYESYQKYIDAKCNIYNFQNEEDYFLYNIDNEMLQKNVKKTNSKTIKVSLGNNSGANIYFENGFVYINGKKIYDNSVQRNLIGDYNLNNIMFVLGVSEILNLNIEKSIDSICSFKTLPHRLEFVGIYDDVLYYDNCIGTTPEATIEVIKALANVDTLIIGGMDRGIDYSYFINYLNNSNIGNIICMPKTGHDISKKLNNPNVICVETLEEAVETSKKVTKKGKSCLISPAAASYGFFKNFEEKGDRFQALVKGEK